MTPLVGDVQAPRLPARLPAHSFSQYRRCTARDGRRKLGYVLAGAIVLLVVSAVVSVRHVRHETRRHFGPSVVVRRVRRAAPGDPCICGGTIGRASGQPGDRLGCTACARSWTADGRKIVRR
jgi:hypothetical protein